MPSLVLLQECDKLVKEQREKIEKSTAESTAIKQDRQLLKVRMTAHSALVPKACPSLNLLSCTRVHPLPHTHTHTPHMHIHLRIVFASQANLDEATQKLNTLTAAHKEAEAALSKVTAECGQLREVTADLQSAKAQLESEVQQVR